MNGQAAETPASGWRGAGPEIIIAAIVVAVAAVIGYAAAGLAGTTVVIAVAAVAALVVLRVMVPSSGPAQYDRGPEGHEATPVTFTGYWRKRLGLVDGMRTMAAYDAELRRTLQNLLAARLAERYGISLRDDPAAARRRLCSRPRDQDLWYWVDPVRPPATAGNAHGIPPRTLARLIDRLEKLGD
jgi:hypothetical protein